MQNENTINPWIIPKSFLLKYSSTFLGYTNYSHLNSHRTSTGSHGFPAGLSYLTYQSDLKGPVSL